MQQQQPAQAQVPGRLCTSVHQHQCARGATPSSLMADCLQALLSPLCCWTQVYQSANHTRLEHSLGVAHLAEEWAWQLLARSVEDGSRGCTSGIVSPSDPEWRQDVQLVSLAGGDSSGGGNPDYAAMPAAPCSSSSSSSGSSAYSSPCCLLNPSWVWPPWQCGAHQHCVRGRAACTPHCSDRRMPKQLCTTRQFIGAHICCSVTPAAPLCMPLPPGLCHDLGHGPYSHVFENELLPRVLGKEAASQWWVGGPPGARWAKGFLQQTVEAGLVVITAAQARRGVRPEHSGEGLAAGAINP